MPSAHDPKERDDRPPFVRHPGFRHDLALSQQQREDRARADRIRRHRPTGRRRRPIRHPNTAIPAAAISSAPKMTVQTNRQQELVLRTLPIPPVTDRHESAKCQRRAVTNKMPHDHWYSGKLAVPKIMRHCRSGFDHDSDQLGRDSNRAQAGTKHRQGRITAKDLSVAKGSSSLSLDLPCLAHLATGSSAARRVGVAVARVAQVDAAMRARVRPGQATGVDQRRPLDDY
jgi:hypothetical protein